MPPVAKSDFIPTAPVGLTVLWKRKGKSPIGAPCVVVQQEEPGIVRLRTLDRKGEEHAGVLFAGHPEAELPESIRADSHGVWDYIDGEVAKKAHYRFHEQVVRERDEKRKRAKEEQEAREAQWLKDQEDIAAKSNGLLETTRIQQQTAAHMAAGAD